MRNNGTRIGLPGYTRQILRRIDFSDPKTDIFLAANVLDAFITYMALQYGTKLTELNSIVYAVIEIIGTGPALFLKVVLCVTVLWILRKTKKEKLLVPLSAILVVIALSNLIWARFSGIQV